MFALTIIGNVDHVSNTRRFFASCLLRRATGVSDVCSIELCRLLMR